MTDWSVTNKKFLEFTFNNRAKLLILNDLAQQAAQRSSPQRSSQQQPCKPTAHHSSLAQRIAAPIQQQRSSASQRSRYKPSTAAPKKSRSLPHAMQAASIPQQRS